MQLIATPTSPLDISIGSMLDLPEFTEEYALLVSTWPTDTGAFLLVSCQGDLHTLVAEEPVKVVTYGLVSNTLDTVIAIEGATK